MKIPLYIDIVNKVAVTSVTSSKPFRLPPLHRGDAPLFEVTLLEPNPTGGLAAPFSKVDVTPLSVEIGIGELHGNEAGTPIAYQDTWTKDETNDLFSAALNLNTTSIAKRLADSAEGRITTWFEVKILESGRKTVVFQGAVVLVGDVIRASGVTPDPVVDFAQFATDVNAVLGNTTTVVWSLTGGQNKAAVVLASGGGLAAGVSGLSVSIGTGAGQVASGANPCTISTTNTISGSVATGALSLTVKLKTDGGLAADSNGLYLDVGNGAGTTFGSSTAKKLGFWGATPIVQPFGASQAAITAVVAINDFAVLGIGASYSQAEVQALRDTCESLAADVVHLTTLVHALRSALVSTGLVKGSA